MIENSRDHVCKPGKSKTTFSSLHLARGVHVTAKYIALLAKFLNDPHVTWKYTRREMMAIARINLEAKWFAANGKNQIAIRCSLQTLQKGARATVMVRALQICRSRRMGTLTVPSATQRRQMLQLHTTSSGDICVSTKTAQAPTITLRFGTPDEQSSKNTLWRENEFKQICSRE